MIAAVAASFCSVSRGETMAERKQRIMRKYLRERQEVVQSDMQLPYVLEEDERVVDSEKYRADVDLTRRKLPVPQQVPMARPVPVQAQNNWMLNQEESEFDPMADPFAEDTGETAADRRKGWLEEWRKKQSERIAEREAATQEPYSYASGRDPYGSGQGTSGYSTQQGRYSTGYAPYGSQPQAGYNTIPSTGNGIGPYGTTSYGSNPSGMLQFPDSGLGSDDSADRTPSSSGYTPYQSPYQKQMEERRKQTTPQQSQPQEFSRPTPYKQWKDNNKGWDPTADDSYLDELMRRNRR